MLKVHDESESLFQMSDISFHFIVKILSQILLQFKGYILAALVQVHYQIFILPKSYPYHSFIQKVVSESVTKLSLAH